MILIGDKKELVMLLPKRDKNGKRSGYWSLACFGTKRHYRRDGSCKHTQGLIDTANPRYQSRIRVDPFGGNS